MSGSVANIRRRLGLTAELVAFPHTIFALPFAFLGMLLGAGGWPSAWELIWITLAMVGARTAAMSFNRIVDRDSEVTETGIDDSEGLEDRLRAQHPDIGFALLFDHITINGRFVPILWMMPPPPR